MVFFPNFAEVCIVIKEFQVFFFHTWAGLDCFFDDFLFFFCSFRQDFLFEVDFLDPK